MKQTSIFSQVFSLSRDSIIYGLSVVLGQFVGFLLVPLYTNYLDPREYGIVEVLNTTATVLGIVLAMGFTTALLRYYASHENEEGKRTVASTAVFFLMATSLVGLLVLELAAGPISSWILPSKEIFTAAEKTSFFRIVFLSLFFNAGIGIALTVFRARGQPVKYAMASVSQFILAVTLNLVFVIALHKGVAGILYAELVTTACIYLVLMSTLVRRVGFRFSKQELKAMLGYGLPLIPSGLGSWVLVMADRWILVHLLGEGPVGIYSLGYKFGMVIQGILVGPIQLAWLPFLFATAKQSRSRETYTRIFTYFLFVALLVALLVSTLSKEVIDVVARPDYHQAYEVIPLIALSYVLYGCYFQLAAGIYLEGKTNYMAVLMGVAAAVNVGLNFALIPRYEIMGSAVATLVGYAILPVGAYIISQRYYRIAYEWGRVIKLALVAVLIFVACLAVGWGVDLVLERSTNDDSILQVGEKWTWTYSYTVTEVDIDNDGGGDSAIDSTATVSSEQTGGRSDSVQVPIARNAACTIDLTVTDVGGKGAGGSVEHAGEEITYEVVVTNTGTLSLTGVSLADSLVDASGVVAEESLNDDDILEVGETWTWTYTYMVSEADIDDYGGGDSDLDNTATVSVTELGHWSDSEEVYIVPRQAACTIDLAITDVGGRGAGGSVDAAGDVITYEVVVTNPGSVSLTGVSLADSLVDVKDVVPTESGVSAKWPRVLISGGLKLLLVLTYPVLLYGIGFFRPEEMNLVKQFVRSAPAWVARRLGRKPSSPDGPGNVGA